MVSIVQKSDNILKIEESRDKSMAQHFGLEIDSKGKEKENSLWHDDLSEQSRISYNERSSMW
jgi:hypothetical protein